MFLGAVVLTLAATFGAAALGYVLSEWLAARRDYDVPEYDPYSDDW